MTELKNRDKSKKRAVILNGAIDVFVSEGYDLASMDRIAETAGVSKKTVYNHFRSKENLFQAILEDILSQSQRLKTIVYDTSKSLEEQLLAFANAEIYLINSPRRLEISRFLTMVFLKDIHYARETVSKYPPVYDMLLKWLKEADEDGRLKVDDFVLAARVFYALVQGAITYPAVFVNEINLSAVEPLLDEIIATFLARYSVKAIYDN